MAVAASFDPTLGYGAQTPFSDQLAFHFEDGAWQVDAAHDSIIAAGNGSSAPVKARLTFFYGKGAQKDTSYPYTTNMAFDDSPSFQLPSNNIMSLTNSETFSTVLMWQPSGSSSIWVPLSSTNWGWGATETLSKWTLVA